jgi:shikimate dehydrogenase
MLYGLIGKKLLHSQSAVLFEKQFGKKHEYRLFEMDRIEQIKNMLEKYPDLRGFNVTIPYKEAIIPYLHSMDDKAKKIGAVNTVRIKRNGDRFELLGYNTDVLGFEKAYSDILNAKHSFALILGTGGASKAVAFVLDLYKIPYLFVSRTKSGEKIICYSDIQHLKQSVSLMVNTTPVGMFPNTDEMPEIPESIFKNKPAIIDIIYNPVETKLMNVAQKYDCEAINGSTMLSYQAEEAWKIWGLI